MNSLAARKKLLVAESELNRVQFAEDAAALAESLRAFKSPAKTAVSIGSSAAAVMAGWAAFRRRKPQNGATKPSWLQTALKVAGAVRDLWPSVATRTNNQND